jgi:hypothetical protein
MCGEWEDGREKSTSGVLQAIENGLMNWLDVIDYKVNHDRNEILYDLDCGCIVTVQVYSN